MTGPESLGSHELEDEFTIESLDGRAHLSLRARIAMGMASARWWVRRPAWLTRRRAGCAALGLGLVAA
jgi:hypothetical protein